MIKSPDESESRTVGFRFSLRTVLIVFLFVASYFAGWVSHRTWSRRQVEEIIADTVRALGAPIQVEKVNDLDVLILTGPKEDVERVQRIVDEIQD